MNERWDIIVVGGGIAGVTAFTTIRENEPTATALLINGEDRIPYKRTKLSKFLATGFTKDQFSLHDESFYSGDTSGVLNNRQVASLDTSSRRITLLDGTSMSYGNLILAQGATPVVVPAWDSSVLLLRSAQDAVILRERALRSKRAIVLGNGILGIEAADQLQEMGLSVSLIGRAERPMRRQLDGGSAAILHSSLERSGVEIRNNTTVRSVAVNVKGSLAVSGEGWVDHGDLVVACLGTRPNLSLAQGAGVAVGGGVLVDWDMQTSDRHITAAGDAIQLPNGAIMHLWHQAEATGKVAGYTAIGHSAPFGNAAYRTKCEVFGHYYFSCGTVDPGKAHDVIQIDRGDEVHLRCVFKGDKLVGINMVDDPDNTKIYEKAVRESWSRGQVEVRFLKI